MSIVSAQNEWRAQQEPGQERRDQQMEALLNRLAKPPRVWIVLMLAAAVLAAFDVSRGAAGYKVSFHVGPASLIALGLIWLPLLLKVFASFGGSLKAGGVEAIMPGVLTRDEAFEILVKTHQVTSASDEEERKFAAQDLEVSVNRLVVPADEGATISKALLVQLAGSYEQLRLELEPGSRRTSAMTRIVNEARALAGLAPAAARRQTSALLVSNRSGDRIVGLGLVQATGDPAVFESVLGLVSGSETAFEMFHALIALQVISFGLSESQKRQAVQVLEQEKTDPRSIGVNIDPELPTLLARTVGILTGSD